MNNIVLNYIEEYWTKEQASAYMEILDFIHAVDEDYITNIESMFFSLNNDADYAKIDSLLEGFVREILIEMLGNIGVIVSDDYPLDNIVLFKIYKEMVSIEHNEQIDFSLGILQSDEDEVNVFYELLTVVGTLDVDESEFNTHIKKILPFTREKLVKYLNGVKLSTYDAMALSEVNPNQTIGDKLKQFIKAVNDDKFYVIELIRGGVNINLPFKSYMDLFGVELFELDLKELSYNLYLFALISSDGYMSPAQTVMNHIEQYVFDMGDVDKINRAVREIQIKTKEMI